MCCVRVCPMELHNELLVVYCSPICLFDSCPLDLPFLVSVGLRDTSIFSIKTPLRSSTSIDSLFGGMRLSVFTRNWYWCCWNHSGRLSWESTPGKRSRDRLPIYLKVFRNTFLTQGRHAVVYYYKCTSIVVSQALLSYD